MSQSLYVNHIHIVFSTKNRTPWLRDMETRKEMFSFLAGFCKELKCSPLIVNGYEDHVHLLVRMCKTMTAPVLIGRIKEGSTKWMNRREGKGIFHWQGGYGAFSVSASHLNILRNYIATQHEHHQKVSFKDEYRRILMKNGAEYHEEYVWD